MDVIKKVNRKDLCLVDSATTHSILKDIKYFENLKLLDLNIHTISSHADLIEGFERANIILPKGTTFIINGELFSSRSIRNLQSFKNIRRNGYHIETHKKNDK